MYVVFDTNAIREYIAGVPENKLEEFVKQNIARMKRDNITVIISPVVIMELLYHLADVNDPKYNVSYRAIKTQMLHSQLEHKASNTSLTPYDLMIANDIFNMRIISREKMYNNLLEMAKYITDKPLKSVQVETQEDLNTNKAWIDEVEDSFNKQIRKIKTDLGELTDIKKFVKTDEFNEIMSFYIIRTSLNLLEQEGKLTKEQILLNAKKWSKMMAEKYPPFISLSKYVVQCIIDSNDDISRDKLLNYIWDIILMFHVNDRKIGGEKVLLVTTDKAMRRAALDGNNKGNMMEFKEFKKKHLS